MESNNKAIFSVKEQSFYDAVTKLTFIFKVAQDGTARLRVIGNSIPFGNRDFQFDLTGELAGAGTNCTHCND